MITHTVIRYIPNTETEWFCHLPMILGASVSGLGSQFKCSGFGWIRGCTNDGPIQSLPICILMSLEISVILKLFYSVFWWLYICTTLYIYFCPLLILIFITMQIAIWRSSWANTALPNKKWFFVVCDIVKS